jgi:hypothetical protein
VPPTRVPCAVCIAEHSLAVIVIVMGGQDAGEQREVVAVAFFSNRERDLGGVAERGGAVRGRKSSGGLWPASGVVERGERDL